MTGLINKMRRLISNLRQRIAPSSPTAAIDWHAVLREQTKRPNANRALVDRYTPANVGAISAALAGLGPDDKVSNSATALAGLGAHMAVNISSVHVPAVCTASRQGDSRPYKNGYDLKHYRIGDALPHASSKTREIVDAALPLPRGCDVGDVYFGAMELNGTGVHFYGDTCFILRDVDPDTRLLDRNSYDLVRAPLREDIEQGNAPRDWPRRRAEAARRMCGTWGESRASMAAIKVFGALGLRARRLTTGQISNAVRDDEDYVEILRIGSFGTTDLREVRMTAADAACEAAVDARRHAGPTPPLEMLLWRDRRRVAETELRANGIPVRVVTTAGRIKG